MSSFAIPFLFITQLGLLLGMLWLWWRAKDRMAALEAKAEEALDDADLMDFQDRIAALLAQVKDAGKDVAALIDERRAGLDRESARARDAEKRLAEKIKDFERVEEKARKRLGEWAAGQSKKSSKKAKPSKKAPEATEPPEPQAEAAAPEAPEAPAAKLSYLKREFRPPEPQAPASPTAARYLKVYELSDQGLSREAIAKACGYLPGEIELILNLRPRPKA
jgi:TolA-binding protein